MSHWLTNSTNINSHKGRWAFLFRHALLLLKMKTYIYIYTTYLIILITRYAISFLLSSWVNAACFSVSSPWGYHISLGFLFGLFFFITVLTVSWYTGWCADVIPVAQCLTSSWGDFPPCIHSRFLIQLACVSFCKCCVFVYRENYKKLVLRCEIKRNVM